VFVTFFADLPPYYRIVFVVVVGAIGLLALLGMLMTCSELTNQEHGLKDNFIIIFAFFCSLTT